MFIRKLFIAIFCFCQIILVTESFGQSPITASELIDRTPLKPYLKALENGEIVIIGRPDSEIGSELDVFMSVLVPAPLTKTVDVLQRLSTSKDTPGIFYIEEITGKNPAS